MCRFNAVCNAVRHRCASAVIDLSNADHCSIDRDVTTAGDLSAKPVFCRDNGVTKRESRG